ncbi:MAG: hypothetical protein MJ153_08170 [Clostridia bacterium]|nr:hypothetical protein [Clostridia bacterium]
MIDIIKKRQKQLDIIIDKMEKEISGLPSGILYRCVNKKRNTVQYYCAFEGNSEKRIYLNPSKDISVIKDLSNKKYCQQVLKSAKSEKEALDSLLHYYNGNTNAVYSDLYSSLDEMSRNITDSFLLSNDEYAKWWQSQEYHKKGFDESNTTEFYTNRGERVRSKSEILIANTLDKLNIPYRYECQLILQDGTIIYPDFTILDIHTREEKYYEHAGRMTDLGYNKDFMWKLNLYEHNGIFVGDKLFVSFESKEYPLSTSTLEKMLTLLFMKISL